MSSLYHKHLCSFFSNYTFVPVVVHALHPGFFQTKFVCFPDEHLQLSGAFVKPLIIVSVRTEGVGIVTFICSVAMLILDVWSKKIIGLELLSVDTSDGSNKHLPAVMDFGEM